MIYRKYLSDYDDDELIEELARRKEVYKFDITEKQQYLSVHGPAIMLVIRREEFEDEE